MYNYDYWNWVHNYHNQYYYNNTLPNIRYVPVIEYPRQPPPPPPYYNSRYTPSYPPNYPLNYTNPYYTQTNTPVYYPKENQRPPHPPPPPPQPPKKYNNYSETTNNSNETKDKYDWDNIDIKNDIDVMNENKDKYDKPKIDVKSPFFSKSYSFGKKEYSPFKSKFFFQKFGESQDIEKNIDCKITKKNKDEDEEKLDKDEKKIKLIENKLDEIKKNRKKIENSLLNLIISDPLKDDIKPTKKFSSFGTTTYSKDDNDLANLFSKFSKPRTFLFGDLSKKINDNKDNDKKDVSEDTDDSEYDLEYIEESIDNLNDLIHLGKLYEEKYNKDNTKYNIKVKTLNKLIEPLTKLNNLIGLKTVKKQVYELIIYYLQKLDNKNKDMLHTVIEGPPGVGKTELAKILADVFKCMGILSKGTFKIAKRNDFVGGYLGQTTIKTQKLLDSCKGGVLFIDEAYSLGNNEGRDSYSKECIDAITAFLTEERNDFICIIAGYKESLEKCFFNYNAGLERRFPYRFKLTKYNAEDLRSIFIKIIKDNDWSFKSDDEIPVDFFEKNIKYFKFNGGDMETLFHKCKIAHSKRMLYCDVDLRKIINNKDLKEGMKLFLDNDDVKKRNESDDWSLNGLYT